jgi:DNA-binding IclR family transcriptional regulator
MTKITIVPERTEAGSTAYRAIAGQRQSLGKTAGEALDTLAAMLPDEERGTLIIVQDFQPDRFFTERQIERLQTLMTRWREARDKGTCLPPDEQAELENLIDAELQGATERAEVLLQEIGR